MRIHYGPDTYAEWTPGARTINLFLITGWSDEEYDVISFGYDKPDNTTTQLEAMSVLLGRVLDDAMDRHPAGSDTVSQIRVYCPTCGGRGDTGPRYSPDTCQSCRGTGVVPR